MRKLLAAAACLVAGAGLAAPSNPQASGPAGRDAPARTRVVLDNARVRVLRANTAPAAGDHPAAVVVPLEDGVTRKTGAAYWSGDPTVGQKEGGGDAVAFIIVEPKDPPALPEATPTRAGSKPGEAVFTGISFEPLFENDRVLVIRGRMEVGAQEGFHTHASDIVIVHLSGGTIEDTAAGTTKLNRWQHGDVEFEARRSSHSARNVGPAVDAVLVTLKP